MIAVIFLSLVLALLRGRGQFLLSTPQFNTMRYQFSPHFASQTHKHTLAMSETTIDYEIVLNPDDSAWRTIVDEVISNDIAVELFADLPQRGMGSLI